VVLGRVGPALQATRFADLRQIFLTLRDERREAAIKIAAKMKRAEEEALLKTD
jgi:hypothetical protein